MCLLVCGVPLTYRQLAEMMDELGVDVSTPGTVCMRLVRIGESCAAGKKRRVSISANQWRGRVNHNLVFLYPCRQPIRSISLPAGM
jgi:transposase-like protein